MTYLEEQLRHEVDVVDITTNKKVTVPAFEVYLIDSPDREIPLELTWSVIGWSGPNKLEI